MTNAQKRQKMPALGGQNHGVHHAAQHPRHSQEFQDRQQGLSVLLAAGAGQGPGHRRAAAPGLDPHRPGVRAAQLRWQESHRRTRPPARQLAGQRQARRRDPLRRGPRGAAGLHRRAAAGRHRRHALRGRQDGQEPQEHRAAGAGGPGGGPLGHDRLLRHQGRAGPEHEAGIQAQPGALPVHEMGHAGVRHLRRRAAGLRHRPPGQP